MKSYHELSKLSHIPKANYSKNDSAVFLERIDILNKQDTFIHASLFGVLMSYHYLELRNVPDELFEAYSLSFTQSNNLLYEHYLTMLEKGDPSVTGFISNMKGKVFEVYLKDNLPLDYPGYSFEIAKDPTQPVWDLTEISENGGEEIFVQAKMWDESRARDLIELMEENPDVLYATNIEMREKIVEINPELVNSFVPVDLSNFEFTDDVRDALGTLADNFGLNMPDSVFALVPYSTEIILGVKFIFELASVNPDFSKVNFDEKSRIAALKVLVLFTRFGVTTILTFAGSAAGSFVPGYGNVVGGIGGA